MDKKSQQEPLFNSSGDRGELYFTEENCFTPQLSNAHPPSKLLTAPGSGFEKYVALLEIICMCICVDTVKSCFAIRCWQQGDPGVDFLFRHRNKNLNCVPYAFEIHTFTSVLSIGGSMLLRLPLDPPLGISKLR